MKQSNGARRSKGALEAEIATAITGFGREQQGRGASDVRAHLMGDLIIVRSRGIFTPVESRLLATEDGRKLIKSARQELRSINFQEAEALVSRIAGCTVVHSFFDVNVQAGEQSEIYVLKGDLEKLLREGA